MKKSLLSDSVPCFIVTIKNVVTVSIFAQALCEKSYSDGCNIDFSNLSKRKANEILKDQLAKHGRCGGYAGLDSLGDEEQPKYNEEYRKAKEWVLKAYPYLKC